MRKNSLISISAVVGYGVDVTVTAVERAFLLLKAIDESDGTLSGLARFTDLPVATVSRLMSTLEGAGAVVRVDKRYRIGPVINELGTGDRGAFDVLAVATPHLNRLAAQTNETAGIAQRDEFDYVHLGQVATEHDVNVRDWTGFRGMAHAGCIGFVLMSHWTEREVESYLASGLEAFSPNTMTDQQAIRRRLERVRAKGWLWTTDEYAQGVTTVASPVFNHEGRAVASLYVYGPSYRFPEAGSRDRLGRVVKQQAAAVSGVLGHRDAA